MREPQIIDYRYGVAETLRYERTEGGGWRRVHKYTPKDGGRPVVESIFAAGPDDATPMHASYPDGYSPDCNHCYLNCPHTTAVHRPRKVAP
jgi:hypothetical protein